MPSIALTRLNCIPQFILYFQISDIRAFIYAQLLSAIIPSYNRKNCILQLLDDLTVQKGISNFEIIVVDDCSSDDTVNSIRRNFPKVKLFVNDQNSGPCVTRNRIHQAKGKIIVGFDSDVSIPDQNLLSKIEKAFDELPNVSGFAFRLYEPDGAKDDSLRCCHLLTILIRKTNLTR